MRWKSSSTRTLRAPSAGLSAACCTISRAAAASMRPWAVVGSMTWRSGWVSARARRAWRSASSPVAAVGEQQRGEGPGGGPLAGAGRADEQVGVDRVGGGRRELGDGVVLADHVGPHVELPPSSPPHHRASTVVRRGRGSGCDTISQIAAATSSGVWVPSTTAKRSGSAMACWRKPSWTRRWKSRRRPPRAGRGRRRSRSSETDSGTSSRTTRSGQQVLGGPRRRGWRPPAGRAGGRSPGRRPTTGCSGR